MDIAIALEALVPGANYFGSLSGGDQAAYDALDWRDEREKPAWADLSPAGLLPLKAALRAGVDKAAETARLKYITAGAGQAMTYAQKADQALRYLAANEPDEADYPLLAAEVGITAADIGAVAEIVSTAYQNWQLLGAAIEAARLGTKKAIDEATTEEAARTAAAAAIWP